MTQSRQFRYSWDDVSGWCTGNDTLYFVLEMEARDSWMDAYPEEFEQVDENQGYEYKIELKGQEFVVTFTWEEQDAEA